MDVFVSGCFLAMTWKNIGVSYGGQYTSPSLTMTTQLQLVMYTSWLSYQGLTQGVE